MNISGLPISIGSSLVGQTRSQDDQDDVDAGKRPVRSAVAYEQSARLPEERVVTGELLEKRALSNSQSATNANSRVFEFDLSDKLRQQQSGNVVYSRKAINAYLSTSNNSSSRTEQKDKIDLYV